MTELDYAGAFRRNWILALLVLVATLVATAIVTSMQRPVYESSAQLVVAPSRTTADMGDVIRSLETLERRTVVATFARLPSTEEVRFAATSHLNVPGKELRRFRTRGSVVPNTNIIRIDTTGPDPRIAAALANASALETARRAESLYRVFSLQFLTRATPASRPAFPDRQRNYLVGAVLGTFLGVIAALAAERLRRPRPSEL